MAAFLFRKLSGSLSAQTLKNFVWLYPPFLGAGITIDSIDDGYRFVHVRLKKRWWNRNYVGTAFGGSIYAMTDPFYMLLIMNNLGRDYIVWDKAASIDFIKPGRTDLTARFEIDDSLIDLVKTKTAQGEKYIFDLPVEIYDANQIKIASVQKTLYVRKKPNRSAESQSL